METSQKWQRSFEHLLDYHCFLAYSTYLRWTISPGYRTGSEFRGFKFLWLTKMDHDVITTQAC